MMIPSKGLGSGEGVSGIGSGVGTGDGAGVGEGVGCGVVISAGPTAIGGMVMDTMVCVKGVASVSAFGSGVETTDSTSAEALHAAIRNTMKTGNTVHRIMSMGFIFMQSLYMKRHGKAMYETGRRIRRTCAFHRLFLRFCKKEDCYFCKIAVFFLVAAIRFERMTDRV